MCGSEGVLVLPSPRNQWLSVKKEYLQKQRNRISRKLEGISPARELVALLAGLVRVVACSTRRQVGRGPPERVP